MESANSGIDYLEIFKEFGHMVREGRHMQALFCSATPDVGPQVSSLCDVWKCPASKRGPHHCQSSQGQTSVTAGLGVFFPGEPLSLLILPGLGFTVLALWMLCPAGSQFRKGWTGKRSAISPCCW